MHTRVCELKRQLLDSPQFFYSAQFSPTQPPLSPTQPNSAQLSSTQRSIHVQVALHEGLMVSVSRAGSLELQTQLLEVRMGHDCTLCCAVISAGL